MRVLRSTVFQATPLYVAALAAFACGSADGDALQHTSGESSIAPGNSNDVAPNAAPGTNTGLVADPPLLGGACTGQVAQDTFAAALCSCEDTNIAGYLRTRGLGDSDAASDLVGS